jgi:hypothetical protein
LPQAHPADEIIDIFSGRIYFGCEADDLLVGWATGPLSSVVRSSCAPILGTDISLDASVMDEVVAEAFELLEDDVINEADFRAFTFDNPVALHKRLKEDLFTGTVCEK